MDHHPQLQVWEPTFKMEPNENEKFLPTATEKIIDEVMKRKLQDKTYNVDEAKQWTLELSNEIKAAVKAQNMPRYKIVVQVAIGENAGQGIRVASKCLWDTKLDSWASISFKNKTLFAVALVIACYHE